MEQTPRVVIVGGGFGGLYAARALGAAPVEITLVDRTNHHVFQPLLYQVATAGLSAIDIAEPIRRILRRQTNTTVLLAEVTSVDLEGQQVCLAGRDPLPYDYLILAAGAEDSYFGHDQWAETAPGLKSIADALEIRRRLLRAFEEAELETDPEARNAWMTFVVIGAGPTGSELAGAIAEISRHTLLGEFRRIDPADARVLLVEGGERVLAAFPPSLSRKAQAQLERLGVEVVTGRMVTGIDEHGVQLGETRIASRTVMWAAGVRASPLGNELGVPCDRMGRVVVEPDLSVPDHPDVFVIGDMAHVEYAGKPVPGVAPAAIQMGRHAAETITGALEGQPPLPYRYVDRGTMATLGRSSAVAQIRRVRLSGYPAWLAWLFVHILFLIGFRDRLVVLFEWTKSYLTYGRSARLIISHDSHED